MDIFKVSGHRGGQQELVAVGTGHSVVPRRPLWVRQGQEGGLRLLVELAAAVELAEVELVRSRSAPETYVAIAARAESETVSSDLGTTKVKIGNMRKEVREAIPERRKE